MATIVGAMTSSHLPAIGLATAKELQQEPYWRPYLRSLTAGARMAGGGETRRGGHHIQRSRPEFLSRQDTDVCRRCGRRISQRRRGLGNPGAAAVPRRPGVFVDMIESLGAAEIDFTTCQEMLVDHAATCRWPALAGRRAWPVPSSRLRQPRAIPAPSPSAAMRSERVGTRARIVGRRKNASSCSAPADSRISSTAARGIHQQALLSYVHGRDGRGHRRS